MVNPDDQPEKRPGAIRTAAGLCLFVSSGLAWHVIMDAAIPPPCLIAAVDVSRLRGSLKITHFGAMWVSPTTLN